MYVLSVLPYNCVHGSWSECSNAWNGPAPENFCASSLPVTKSKLWLRVFGVFVIMCEYIKSCRVYEHEICYLTGGGEILVHGNWACMLSNWGCVHILRLCVFVPQQSFPWTAPLAVEWPHSEYSDSSLLLMSCASSTPPGRSSRNHTYTTEREDYCNNFNQN